MTHLRLLLAALCLGSPGGFAADLPPRPNIVFILADDLGWNDVGYHGSEIATPNLDRLAAAGAKMERHYVYATCSPTRVGLLSGRYPSRFGVLAPLGSTTEMRGEEATLPQELRRLGYRTHLSGKWHLGETPGHRPRNYGFDTTYGYLRGQIDPYTHRYKTGDHVTWHRNDEFIEEEGHVTDLITAEALRVVETAGEEPFFLYVAHHAPHSPLNEPPRWIAPFAKTIAEPSRRHFAAAVSHLDDSVGKLMAALEEAGKAAHTLVIFSSDNGGQQNSLDMTKNYDGRYASLPVLGNNEPLRGWKGDLYEGGIRVPAFAIWPGTIKPGTTVDAPMHICDWVPTLLALAGGEIDPAWKLDGIDMGPVLLGKEGEIPDRTLYWCTPSATALRKGDWKLILSGKGAKPELFNLADDPNESIDLAAKETDRVAEMTVKLESIREGDSEIE